MPDNDLCETPQPTQQSVLNRTSKDKFILVLNLPLVLRKKIPKDELLSLDPLQISVFGTIVPEIAIPSTEVRFGGQAYNVTSHSRPNYPPLPVDFVIDNKFRNYWLLWSWLNILNESTTSYYSGINPNSSTWKDNIDSGILTEYQTNFSILGLNEYNQYTVEFLFKNAFITNLGGIMYNYTDTDIIKASAQFQFSQLEVKLLK